MIITSDTPVAFLTVGQLKKIFRAGQRTESQPADKIAPNTYVYGLRGIRNLFGVSHATAQRYKDTILKDAVSQNGRKIIVDVDKALELFNKKNGGNK